MQNIQLHTPKKEELAFWKSYLNQYTVMQLRPMSNAIFSAIMPLEKYFSDIPANVQEVYTTYKSKKNNPIKQLMLDFIGLFLASPQNLRVYFDALPQNIKEVWRHIIVNRCVRTSEIQKLYNFECVTKSQQSYWMSNHELVSEMSFFRIESTTRYQFFMSSENSEKDFFIFSTSPFIKLFIPLFYKKEEYEKIQTFKDLPISQSPMIRFNPEMYVLSEVVILESLIKQNFLPINDKNKIGLSDIKKAATRMGLAEFFPNRKGEVLHLRALLFLPFFAILKKATKNSQSSPMETLKKFLPDLPLCRPSWAIPLLLPFISGMRSSVYQASEGIIQLDSLLKQLRTANTKEWISVEQWLLYNRANDINYFPFEAVMVQEMNMSSKLTNKQMLFNQYDSLLTVSFVKAFLFLLASFGVLELAYEDYDPNLHDTPFHTLRFVRMTEMGSYLLRLSKKYTPTSVTDFSTLFELDEINFVIRSLKENNPHEKLLQDIAEPIGSQRYKMTHASFLKSCATANDVKNKIAFFNQFICSDLPPLWIEFFDALKRHCQPLKEIPTQKYSIYQLDPKNKELLRLVSSDPIIKQVSIRAENYILLVETNKAKVVTDRLKTFGYLL